MGLEFSGNCKIKRNLIINIDKNSCTVTAKLSKFNTTPIFKKDFKKTKTIIFQENRTLAKYIVDCGWTDRQ